MRYVGINKIRNNFRNMSEFLLDCIIYPSQADCSDVGKITAKLNHQHLICLSLGFPDGEGILSLSVTFYTDSLENPVKKYVPNHESSIKSSGIVYEVLEQQHDDSGTVGFKSAPPGLLTTIHIHQQVSKRLPHPYGKCVATSTTEYSYNLCIMKCNIKGVKKEYNCVNLVQNSELDNSTVMDYCFDTNQALSELVKKEKCVKTALARLTNECFSVCNYRCVTTDYLTQATYSHWPLSSQYDSFYKQSIPGRSSAYKFDHLFHQNQPMDALTRRVKEIEKKQLIAENFVGLEFKFNSMVYLEFEEVPLYSLSSLVGALCGSLNLWTGTTVLSVFSCWNFGWKFEPVDWYHCTSFL